MRPYKILCFGTLFFVFARQGAFAQCGQTTHQSAISIAPRFLPTLTIAKPYSEDRTVVLQLEMTEKGSVRDVEVFEDPGTLRAAALSAAVKFASTEKYLDRRTWPFITVVVRFPQTGHGTPKVGQGIIGGVPGCVFTPPPLRVKVSSWVMGCLLLDRVEPIYPAETENIKDRLTLDILVGKDGNVTNARKISGPENLVPAAIEAVRKWKYRPYLLNGEPIEVDTTVDLPAVVPTCVRIQWQNPPAAQDPFSVTSTPPSWLFNTQPVIPVLAAPHTQK